MKMIKRRLKRKPDNDTSQIETMTTEKTKMRTSRTTLVIRQARTLLVLNFEQQVARAIAALIMTTKVVINSVTASSDSLTFSRKRKLLTALAMTTSMSIVSQTAMPWIPSLILKPKQQVLGIRFVRHLLILTLIAYLNCINIIGFIIIILRVLLQNEFQVF